MIDRTRLDMALMSLHAYNVGYNPHLKNLDDSSVGSATFLQKFE